MTLFKLVPDKFQSIAKLVTSVIFLLLLWFAWNQFTNHYINIGKAQVQPKLEACLLENATLIASAEYLLKAEKIAQDKGVEAIKKLQPIVRHHQEQKIKLPPIEATCEQVISEIQDAL